MDQTRSMTQKLKERGEKGEKEEQTKSSSRVTYRGTLNPLGR